MLRRPGRGQELDLAQSTLCDCGGHLKSYAIVEIRVRTVHQRREVLGIMIAALVEFSIEPRQLGQNKIQLLPS